MAYVSSYVYLGVEYTLYSIYEYLGKIYIRIIVLYDFLIVAYLMALTKCPAFKFAVTWNQNVDITLGILIAN